MTYYSKIGSFSNSEFYLKVKIPLKLWLSNTKKIQLEIGLKFTISDLQKVLMMRLVPFLTIIF